MKPAWMIIAVCLLLVVIAATWWMGDRQSNTSVTALPRPAPTRTAQTDPAPFEEQRAEVETGTEAPTPTETSYARNITHVPDTRPTREYESPVTDIREITAGNAEELLQTNLDNALAGDMASAYFVNRARMTCERFSRTPEDLERRIARTNKKVERDIKRGREISARGDRGAPWSAGADPEDNRANLEEWYAACQRVQSMFTPDLREQLETRAMRGDVMAGYLYASWPLEQLDVGMAFEQQFRWEGFARDFSQANLDKGEVAGLIAFAQTYMNGSFTERNADLALAFAIAAINCNAEAIAFLGFMTNRIDNLSSSEDARDQERLQFALVESERLGGLCIR